MEIFEHVAKLQASYIQEDTYSILLTGYYLVGDRGGGLYARMAKNTAGPGVITSADGAYWQLSEPFPNVFQFGATGDGVTDDTAALHGALSLMVSGGGKLLFPSGTYNYTSLSLDNASGLTLEGAGPVVLNCTETGTSGGLSARSTSGLTLCGITFTHASSAFLGYLLDLSPVAQTGAPDSQNFHAENCTFGSNGLYSAMGANLDKVNGAIFDNCRFQGLINGVNGQTGASYSVQVGLKDCTFSDNSGYAINNPGARWSLQNCAFLASTTNPCFMIYHGGSANPWSNLVLDRCSICNMNTAAPNPIINLGSGQNLVVRGGSYGGVGDTFLDAQGVVSNLRVVDNCFTNFATVFTSGGSGQTCWSIGPGNSFTSCPVVVANTVNVSGLVTDLNTPNVSQGVFAPGAGSRNSSDGSTEQWGTISCAASGPPGEITFPNAFANACLNVQLTLASPSAGTNVVYLSGSPTNTGFTYQAYGVGTNTIVWRALGW